MVDSTMNSLVEVTSSDLVVASSSVVDELRLRTNATVGAPAPFVACANVTFSPGLNLASDCTVPPPPEPPLAGPPGPQGDQGDQGDVGPAGPGNLRWAKVDADATSATLLSGSGVTSVSKVGTVYNVTFDSPIVGCGWTATLNDNTGGAVLPGEIAIEAATSSATETSLYVRTYNSAGTQGVPDDSDGFTVMVSCP
jgi:hypothetical protein